MIPPAARAFLQDTVNRVPLLVLVVAVGVALAGGDAAESLRYERAAVLAGQWWRLLTGHLVHLGWGHLSMNLLGLVLVTAIAGRQCRTPEWSALFVAGALGVSGLLLLLNPEVGWYVGLSGILHGLLVAVGLAVWKRHRLESSLLLAALVAKLAWEQWSGPVPGSTRWAGGPVIVDAHLYGAVTGAAMWSALAALRRATGSG